MKNENKKPKTVEELTKGYEELAKKKGYSDPSKEDFDKAVKKTVNNSKDNQK